MHHIVALVLCVAAAAAAQSPMDKLSAAFSGHWTISVKAEPGPGQPVAVTASGEEDWHTLAGGIPLVEEYHSKAANGSEGYDSAAFWWDASAEKYRGVFCGDFVDTGCASFDVAWAPGDKNDGTNSLMTLTGKYLSGGKEFSWRETFQFTAKHAFVQTLFLGAQGQELKAVSVLTAARSAR